MPARRSVRIKSKNATVETHVASRKQERKERKKLLRRARRIIEIEAARTVAAGRPLCANCQVVHDAANVRHAAQPSAKKAAHSAANSSPEEGTSSHTPPAAHVGADSGTSEAGAPYVPRFVDPADAATPEERARIMRDRKIFGLQVWSWVVVFPFVAVCLNSWRSQPNEPWLVGLRA